MRDTDKIVKTRGVGPIEERGLAEIERKFRTKSITQRVRESAERLKELPRKR